jgi:stringent starvation protein B
MTPSRPYLLRAFYQWIVDNNLTVYIVVDAELPGVDVPKQYIEDGKIVLNISPKAVQQLDLSNDAVSFSARFSGIPYHIYVPVRAVTAIYAKENGRGMVFKEEEDTTTTDEGGSADIPKRTSDKKGGNKRSGRPNLTVVK